MLLANKQTNEYLWKDSWSGLYGPHWKHRRKTNTVQCDKKKNRYNRKIAHSAKKPWKRDLVMFPNWSESENINNVKFQLSVLSLECQEGRKFGIWDELWASVLLKQRF